MAVSLRVLYIFIIGSLATCAAYSVQPGSIHEIVLYMYRSIARYT